MASLPLESTLVPQCLAIVNQERDKLSVVCVFIYKQWRAKERVQNYEGMCFDRL
jgi:hypothetical protein